MDISVESISANKLNSIKEVVSVKMLKGTLDLQEELAKQLIEAIKVPDIGQNVDVTA